MSIIFISIRKSLPLFIGICRKLRIIAGYPLFELISIAGEMKFIDNILDYQIPQAEGIRSYSLNRRKASDSISGDSKAINNAVRALQLV